MSPLNQPKDSPNSTSDSSKYSISEILKRCFPRRLKRNQSQARTDPHPYPLNLSTDQLDSLRRLQSTPGWRQWQAVLEELYKNELARLVGGLEHKEYLVVSGRVQALETVYSLIDTLDRQAREIDEHKPDTRATERQIRTQRDLAFAGSVWWDPSRRKP